MIIVSRCIDHYGIKMILINISGEEQPAFHARRSHSEITCRPDRALPPAAKWSERLLGSLKAHRNVLLARDDPAPSSRNPARTAVNSHWNLFWNHLVRRNSVKRALPETNEPRASGFQVPCDLNCCAGPWLISPPWTSWALRSAKRYQCKPDSRVGLPWYLMSSFRLHSDLRSSSVQ